MVHASGIDWLRKNLEASFEELKLAKNHWAAAGLIKEVLRRNRKRPGKPSGTKFHDLNSRKTSGDRCATTGIKGCEAAFIAPVAKCRKEMAMKTAQESSGSNDGRKPSRERSILHPNNRKRARHTHIEFSDEEMPPKRTKRVQKRSRMAKTRLLARDSSQDSAESYSSESFDSDSSSE